MFISGIEASGCVSDDVDCVLVCVLHVLYQCVFLS